MKKSTIAKAIGDYHQRKKRKGIFGDQRSITQLSAFLSTNLKDLGDETGLTEAQEQELFEQVLWVHETKKGSLSYKVIQTLSSSLFNNIGTISEPIFPFYKALAVLSGATIEQVFTMFKKFKNHQEFANMSRILVILYPKKWSWPWFIALY